MSDVLMITASEGATPDGVAAVGLIESGNRYYTYRPNGEGTYPFWSLSWSTSPGPRWILRYYPEEGVSALWVRADASPFGDYVANSGATGTVTISIPVYVEALKCHLIGDGAVLVNQNMLGGGPMLNDKKSLISE